MKCSLYFFASIFLLSILSCSGDTELPSSITNPNNPVEEEMMEQDLVDAPDFSLESLGGGDLTLDQFEDKVLVISFFGHNCPPCVSAGPKIESDLNQAFNSREDFAMIGIDVWDGNEAQVEIFKDKTTATFPLGLKGSSVMSDFKSQRDRLVVVNKEGKIAFSGKSVAKNDVDEVKGILNTLLD